MFKVKLISYSQPPADSELSEDLLQMVAYCARVSNPGNQSNEKTCVLSNDGSEGNAICFHAKIFD